MDPEGLAEALASETYELAVRLSFMSGVRSGVNGTPTFFINGERHRGPWDEETLGLDWNEADAQTLVRDVVSERPWD